MRPKVLIPFFSIQASWPTVPQLDKDQAIADLTQALFETRRELRNVSAVRPIKTRTEVLNRYAHLVPKEE